MTCARHHGHEAVNQMHQHHTTNAYEHQNCRQKYACVGPMDFSVLVPLWVSLEKHDFGSESTLFSYYEKHGLFGLLYK